MIKLCGSLILVLLLIPRIAATQEQVPGFRWSAKKLDWADFQCTGQSGGHHGALARSYWKLDVSEADTTSYRLNKGIKLKIVAYFIPSRSWVSPDMVGNPPVLAHEQLHFDIVEVYARKLRKSLSKEEVTIKNYKKVVNRIKKSLFRELDTIQKQYDATHREKWQEWSEKVAHWLEEVKEFQSEEVLIPLAG